MKDTITPNMIEAVQEALKHADYDFETLKIDVFGGEISPCSVTQALFPQIIDMALEHLKRKASMSLVEWMDEPDPKTNNKDWTKEKGSHLKNKTLPVFDWNLVK